MEAKVKYTRQQDWWLLLSCWPQYTILSVKTCENKGPIPPNQENSKCCIPCYRTRQLNFYTEQVACVILTFFHNEFSGGEVALADCWPLTLLLPVCPQPLSNGFESVHVQLSLPVHKKWNVNRLMLSLWDILQQQSIMNIMVSVAYTWLCWGQWWRSSEMAVLRLLPCYTLK